MKARDDVEAEIKKLQSIPCPICGKMPYIQGLYRLGTPGRNDPNDNEYKVHCPNHHIDCCDWKKTPLEAWRLWKKRTTDVHQPDFGFNDNEFSIQHMNLDELADFLYRWQRSPVGIMCKDFRTGCAFSCKHNEECGEYIAGVPTVETIKRWLQKPVDGIYPKGYPGVPEELQNRDDDIYRYRKKQAMHKI